MQRRRLRTQAVHGVRLSQRLVVKVDVQGASTRTTRGGEVLVAANICPCNPRPGKLTFEARYSREQKKRAPHEVGIQAGNLSAHAAPGWPSALETSGAPMQPPTASQA